MRIQDALYRIRSYVTHVLTAWNTGGEGIHSPKLFYIVRMLLYDTNGFYGWNEIEERRQAMLHAPKLIHVDDYGTGQSGQKMVQDIAKTSLCSVKEGRMYFRLVNYLSREKKVKNPACHLTILELGTSLGISAAYLALPDSGNRVVTIEGSREVAEMAKMNWQQMDIKNVECVEGNIDDILDVTLKNKCAHARVDLGLLDANHTKEATLRYFDHISEFVCDSTILIVDDIHYSHEMGEAWQNIKHCDKVTSTIDLYECGLVFFDKHYLKKHYRLRW